MCDTLIALGKATVDGSVVFAKNSDREPNEAHEVLVRPAENHAPGSSVRCTYIEIPQAAHTFAVLLAKPFNIWGAEMGANEHGVVIGNEAVFTRVPYEKGPGLTGMDMIRLALEGGSTARQALDMIVSLLEQHGQGGNCGFAHPFYYHNSFLIGDPRDAWVLETAGKQWAAQQVKEVRSISNQLTIGRDWDISSAGLVDYAIDRGWCRKRGEFDFAKCYSDPLMTFFSASGHRRGRSSCLLADNKGKIDAGMMMSALRDHGGGSQKAWRPDRGLTGSEICMHAGFGPVRINQTVGSLISHLSDAGHTHWVTATSAPCTSIFKPIWIDVGMPDTGEAPEGVYDPGSLWWRHERLHRQVLQDYPGCLPGFQAERDRLEAAFLQGAKHVNACTALERLEFSQRCFRQADEAAECWEHLAGAAQANSGVSPLFRAAWKRFNQQADFPRL